MSNIPAGYQQTDIGLIPSDWEVITIDEILNFVGGSQPPRDNFIFDEKEGYVRLLQIRDYKTDRYASYIPSHLARKKCDKDDIMIGRYGPPIFQILRGLEGAYNVALIKAIPKQNITREFGWFILNQETLFDFVEKLSQRSSGQTGVDLNELKKYQIPFPPTKAEQTAISTALSDADMYISSLEKLIAKKQAIKQGAMQQLLTPKADWVVKKLGEVAEIYTGKRNNQDKVEDGAYPFFVRSQDVERINSYSFDGEAILIPGEGGIGNIFHYINGKFDYHQRVYKISDFAEGYSARFIFFFMKEHFGKEAMKNSVKATVDSLRLPTFTEYEIPFPSINDQTHIATILSDMDAEIATLEKQLAKARSIKQGMMQQLLTGKIRLI